MPTPSTQNPALSPKQRYSKSSKGLATKQRYNKSSKGKAAQKRYRDAGKNKAPANSYAARQRAKAAGYECKMAEAVKESVLACEICGRYPKEDPKGLCIDHNHKTGEIRGRLCFRCNRGLGQFGDSPFLIERALSYLKQRGSAC